MSKTKRITSFVLAILILISILTTNVFAYDNDDDWEDYEEYSGTTGSCTWSYDETSGTLTISGNGAMEDYENATDVPWIGEDIDEVVINSGVTSVGDHCFERYYANVDHDFSTVFLPSSITRIGNFAFANCFLTSLSIPKSVKTIGSYAFKECVFKTITIPESVTSIGNRAFYNCWDLKSLTLPSGIKSIASNAFEDAFELSKVTYKGTKSQWQKLNKKTSIKSLSGIKIVCNNGSLICVDTGKVKYTYDINKRVLYFHKGDCKSINNDELFYSDSTELKAKKVIFEKGVTGFSIDTYYTVGGFKNVESISISATVSELNITTDYGVKLERITVNKKNKKYSSKSGVLFNKKKTVLYNYPGNKKSTKYTIPSSVKTIQAYAFNGSKYLKKVIMKNNVTKLCQEAFRNSSIVEITLSKKLKKIGPFVFADCFRLKKLKNFKSAKITYIGEGAFMFCSNIKGVLSIPKSVKTIGRQAFSFCPNIKVVITTKNLKKIGAYALGHADIGTLVKDFTIYGVKNSAAHKYAKEYGFKFVAI